MVWIKAGSQVAPIAIAAGKRVVGCFDHTPCRVWFHPPHAGPLRREHQRLDDSAAAPSLPESFARLATQLASMDPNTPAAKSLERTRDTNKAGDWKE